jgi:hypothetical protein
MCLSGAGNDASAAALLTEVAGTDACPCGAGLAGMAVAGIFKADGTARSVCMGHLDNKKVIVRFSIPVVFSKTPTSGVGNKKPRKLELSSNFSGWRPVLIRAG